MRRFFVALAMLALLLGVGLPVEARAEGTPPVPENLELETPRGMLLRGRLSARDAEGDLASFAITTRPVKGDISLEADGRFVYYPRPGKRGRDYFGFRAFDQEGNVSQEATAIIRIL